MRRGRATARLTRVVVVVILVVVTALVVVESRTLLEIVVVVKASAALMTSMLPCVPVLTSVLLSVLLELSIIVLRRTGHGLGRGRLRVPLVRSWRIRARPLMRSIWLWWVAITHWSIGISRRTVIKSHPNRRTHRLGFSWLVVVSSPTSGSAVLLLMRLALGRVGGRGGTPLLLGRTTWLLLRWVRLSVRLLGRRSAIGRLLLRVLGSILRLLLLLLVEVLSVVGVIVLRGQRRLARVLWMLRLSLFWPLLLVLGIATWARLGELSVSRWILSWVLRYVWLSLVLRWLLRVAVGGQSRGRGRSIVVRPAYSS